jgi:hypothetical protein
MPNPTTRLLPLARLLLLPVLPFSGCLDSGGTEIPNEVTGTLYISTGAPAVNAQITLLRADYTPGAAADDSGKFQAQTNAAGRFSFPKVPAGYYNVIAAGDGKMAFRDSVAVNGGATVPPDTLRAGGTVSAMVQLHPHHSPQTATVQVLGTEQYLNVPANGWVTLTLPRGTYNLRVAVSLPDYTPLFTTVTVRSGMNDTITEPLIPFYSGIPVVTGLTATADSAGRVRLKWNSVDYPAFRRYRIHRVASGSLDPGIPLAATTDTAWTDTVFAQAFGQPYRDAQFPYSDVTPKTFDYRVRVESMTEEVGLPLGYVTATAHSAAYFSGIPGALPPTTPARLLPDRGVHQS